MSEREAFRVNMSHIQTQYEAQITSLVRASHRLAELGYVTSSGGNLSLRVNDSIVLITPTKTPKRLMCFDDICAVDLEGNLLFSAEGKSPTGELPFHLRIMRKRPDIKAIVHGHPPLMTGFAIANSDLLEKPFLPEPVIEVGPLLRVPYETPLSEALSEQFDKVIHQSDGFLMENHGAVLCSVNNVLEAVEFMQMIECMAQSILVSMQLGTCKSIPASYVKELDKVISMRNLNMPGAPGRFVSVMQLYGLEE